MTNEEIAVKLENHEQQIKSLKHRMDEQEEQGKTLNNLALSVQEWALNTKSMLEEQKNQGDRIDRQGERLEKLENEPAEKWNYMTRTIFAAVLSAIGGALGGGVITMIVQQYIR